jgi:hypothetical protein
MFTGSNMRQKGHVRQSKRSCHEITCIIERWSCKSLSRRRLEAINAITHANFASTAGEYVPAVGNKANKGQQPESEQHSKTKAEKSSSKSPRHVSHVQLQRGGFERVVTLFGCCCQPSAKSSYCTCIRLSGRQTILVAQTPMNGHRFCQTLLLSEDKERLLATRLCMGTECTLGACHAFQSFLCSVHALLASKRTPFSFV